MERPSHVGRVEDGVPVLDGGIVQVKRQKILEVVEREAEVGNVSEFGEVAGAVFALSVAIFPHVDVIVHPDLDPALPVLISLGF